MTLVVQVGKQQAEAILQEIKNMTAAMQQLTSAANTLSATVASAATTLTSTGTKEDPVALAAVTKTLTDANTTLTTALSGTPPPNVPVP